MVYWMIGIVLFIVLFAWLLMSKIEITVGFHNQFFFRLKLPFKTIDSNKKQTKEKSKQDNKKKTKKESNEPYDNFTGGFRHYKKFYRENRDKIKSLLRLFQKSAVVEKFYFQYYYGFEDAAFNAIAFGIVNGIVYNVYALVSHHFKVKNTDIKIAPDFNNHLKIIEFESIIKIRIADIMINCLKVIPLLLKLRKMNQPNSSAK